MTFHLRDATVRDAPALAALHVRAFQEAHGDGPSVALREGRWNKILARGETRDFTLLVEDTEDGLVAFARGTPHDGGVPGFEGELNKIHVPRARHRRGFGRLLVCEVASRLLRQEVHSMLLFGDVRSPSNGFYERLDAKQLYAPG